MLELAAIENFVAFYQCKSMTKAAELQFISRQAISKSIKNLENTLGVKREKTLSVVCTRMTQNFYYSLLREWKQLNPDFEMQISIATPEEIYLGLYNGIYDLGIVFDGSADSQIGEYVLKKDTVSVFMNSEDVLAKKQKLRLQDLEDRIVLMPQLTKNYNQDLCTFIAKRKLRIHYKVSPVLDMMGIVPLIREGNLFIATTDFFSYYNLGKDFVIRDVIYEQGMPEKKVRMLFRKNEANDVQISGIMRFLRQRTDEKLGNSQI